MKELTEKQKIAKKYVLEDFDFEKVSKAMRLFDWEWGYEKTSHFPSAKEIEESASRLIDDLFKNEYDVVESGGLVARIEKQEGFGEVLILEFVLECGQGGRVL